MSTSPSILDELRARYEAARVTHHDHSDVEGYEQINARMRKAYTWLDKAFSYLDGVKPAIDHRFDVGHGLVFEQTRFGRGYVGQHERRIVGFPVIDEINIYYEIAAAKALNIDVAPAGVQSAEKALDDVGLQYTCKRVEDHSGVVRKCVITVPPAIPAKVGFNVDYQTGIVTVPLVGRSSPASRCMSVDLPEPDGPMIAVKEPGWISIETPRSALTSASPSP